MHTLTHMSRATLRLPLLLGAASLALLCPQTSPAYPVSETIFRLNSPFAGTGGTHSLVSSDGLVTTEAWADTAATVPANIWQWWWCYGVDSGTGNGALIDGSESMTLVFDKSVGASMISFFYTGGDGGHNRLARLTISGFTGNPGASAATAGSPRISNLSFANGALSFDYLDDGGGDYGILNFSNPAASAGKTLKITGATSPNGDSSGWHASLYQVNVQEAFGGPQFKPTSVPLNTVNTIVSQDGLLTIKGFSDSNATTPANLGRYQDECFGVYGGPGGNVVDSSESLTLQFAANTGLSRLDSVYSGGTVSISGFLSDPGFVDPSSGAVAFGYADGTLSISVANGGLHSFYFANRAASAGQTLALTVDHNAGSQFGIGGIGYASIHSFIGPDVDNSGVVTQTTPDGLLTLAGFSDLQGTSSAYLNAAGDWFGIWGNNSESIDSTESLQLRFAPTAGLTSIATRYTAAMIVISGFASNPGLDDPSGTATIITYANGTLSYTFHAPNSPERMVRFNNLSASAGKTLTMHTASDTDQQITLTQINYAVQAPSLSIVKNDLGVIVTWSGGSLQQSDAVNGTFSDVQNASSPLTISAPTAQKFFRVAR